MLNWIFAGMVLLSFLCAILTGRMPELSAAVMSGAQEAVTLVISMTGMMCLWTGLVKVSEASGMTRFIAKILYPVLKHLFPKYRKDSRALQYICMNITANLLGMGNAATPLGLAAMKEMQKENRFSTIPDNSMVTFVVMNTASIQLIPATLGALRASCGSQSPFIIMPAVWITSAATLVIALSASWLFGGKKTHG